MPEFVVTVYKEDAKGFWTDQVADTYTVPGADVVGLKMSTGEGGLGDEIVFVRADGTEINAIDIDDKPPAGFMAEAQPPE